MVSNSSVICACTQQWTGFKCQLSFSGDTADGPPLGIILGCVFGAIGLALIAGFGVVIFYKRRTKSFTQLENQKIKDKQLQDLTMRNVLE